MTRNKAAIAILALVVSACGGGGELGAVSEAAAPSTTGAPVTTSAPTTTTPPPTTSTLRVEDSPELRILQSAFAAGAESFTGRFEGVIEVIGGQTESGVVDVSVPFGGSYDHADQELSFYVDLSGFAAATADEQMPDGFELLFGRMQVRQVGDTVYIQAPFVTSLLGVTTPWVSLPAEEGMATVDQFSTMSPVTPDELFEAYSDMRFEVIDLGEESINGVVATHYRIEIDLAEAIAQLGNADSPLAGRSLPEGSVPVDIWISEDGQIVRFTMELDGSALGDEGDFERMSMRYDFYYGEDVAVEAPPASEVTDGSALQGFGFPMTGVEG